MPRVRACVCVVRVWCVCVVLWHRPWEKVTSRQLVLRECGGYCLSVTSREPWQSFVLAQQAEGMVPLARTCPGHPSISEEALGHPARRGG